MNLQMKETLGVPELIAAAAAGKAVAADARRPASGTAEKPRDAIVVGLKAVAASIAAEGFEFSPAQLALTRRHGDLTFRIRAQSNRNNLAGKRAAIWVHLFVFSRATGAWRKTSASPLMASHSKDVGWVTAGQIGSFNAKATWLEWDFANPGRRAAMAADLTATIKRSAFPVFAAFTGTADDIAALAGRSFVAPTGMLEYLLASGEPDTAHRALDLYLSQNPAKAETFWSRYREFREAGLPRVISATTDTDRLAALVIGSGMKPTRG